MTTTTTFNAFKELVHALEKNKNCMEEHEFLNEDELNTLKQTSSLVAKFQKEALTERENRRSAELQAQEKERLVSDAWKIVSALKKDKYDLEAQLEKLKRTRSITTTDRIRKDLDQISSRAKTDLSNHEKRTRTILRTTPKENGIEVEPDCLIPSSSNDSNEKQDSIKESTSEGEVSADDSLVEELRRILRDEDSSSELEEGEVKMSSDTIDDTTDKRYSPSDMIKLFTAKPYFHSIKGPIVRTGKSNHIEHDRSRTEHYPVKTTQEECSGNNGEFISAGLHSHGLAEYNGFAEDFQSIDMDSNCRQYYSEESADTEGCSLKMEVNIPKLHLEDEWQTTHADNKERKSSPTHKAKDLTRSHPKGFKKRNNALRSEEGDRYGRHAPKVVSPLVLNSRSSSDDVHFVRDDFKKQEDLKREMAQGNTKTLNKKLRDIMLTKTDSHIKLINTGSSGLPGGIVGKRIKDLAKRLKIGHSYPLKSNKNMSYSDSEDYRNPAPGVCGLENLGNSCFMNAGLQCLFVIKPFYRFFLEGGHKNILRLKFMEEQNISLCELLGQLIDKVFSGCYLTCEPSALFATLQAQFPHLDGFVQHDCQEFLALFLDALHQELNTTRANQRRRIRHETMSNARIADQWWKLYNDENESVIADTFHGQFRNKIRCSVCSHVSITYQAFSFLSLPLVSQKLQSFVITVVRNNDGKFVNNGKPKALRVRVQATKPTTTVQIKQRLVSLFPLNEQPDVDNLFLAVVRRGTIVGLLHDHRIVTPFNDKENKLYAYEPLSPPTGTPPFPADRNTTTTSNMNRTAHELHDTARRLQSNIKLKLTPLDSVTRNSSVKASYACHSKEGRAKTRASLPIGYHLTYTCSICLQARPTKQLLQHDDCGKVFCWECLEVSSPLCLDDSIDCPDCLRPSSVDDAHESKIRYCNVPILFRNKDSDENESTVFGHPNLATLPCAISGHDLYNHLATLLPVSYNDKKTRCVPSLPFTLHLVDYQGTRCSRCDEREDCMGCCIHENDVVVFQNGDHIAIELTNIIQLEVDKMSRYCDHESMRVKHFTCKLQLQDCLRSFVDREQLQDLWECPDCNQERSATKSMSLCRYPDTLIIHLKRYRQSYIKIHTPVEFPLQDLDMNEFMHGINSPRDLTGTRDNLYDLVGVVCHEGDFESGHYKAYTRHGMTSEWHLFDDYKVSKESPSAACHTSAYLLFYNRKSSSPLFTSSTEDVSYSSIERSTGIKANTQSTRRKSKDKAKSIKDNAQKTTYAEKAYEKVEKAQDILHPSVAKTQDISECLPDVVHSSVEDIKGAKNDFSSTPKERVSEGHRHQTSDKQVEDKTMIGELDIIKDPDSERHEQPVQCDCSQCDYYRELEQQIKRCRRSISGSETRSKAGSSAPSSRGVSPRKRHSREATPIKRTTPIAVQHEAHERKSHERTPQLASSDSVDSDLNFDENKTKRRLKKRHASRKPQQHSPLSSSSELIPEMDNSASNHVKSNSDNESRGMTDSAVQCTIMTGDEEERRKSTRSSAVQVSLVPDNDTLREEDDIVHDVQHLTRILICAVGNEDMKKAADLLEEGADPSLVVDGITALHLATGMQSSLCCHFTQLFLDHGANPNVKSLEGLTPVHVAAVWGNKDCLKLLMEKGGDPYSEDAEGRNAIDLAKDYEHDTSADTSEYLHQLDKHYTSKVHSTTYSNTSLTSEISVSELDKVPYTKQTDEEEEQQEENEEDDRHQNVQLQQVQIPIYTPEASSSASAVGCGSWTRGLKRRVRRNKVVRSVSGNLRKTSSRLAGRFRSFSDHFSPSSGN